MTRDLLLELALLFELDAEHAATGQRARYFKLDDGTCFRSTFEGAEPRDYDEADRLDMISDELRERAEGKAA